MTTVSPLLPVYMDPSDYLFPVYEEGSNTAVFFVSPAAVPPAIVSYGAEDRYARKGHYTQFLKVPLEVPNYLALCQEPGQIPFTHQDEIKASEIQALNLIVSLKVDGADQHFFINTTAFSNTTFIKGVADDGMSMLNMRVMNFGGFTAEDFKHEKVGEEIFANFKAAGYEPMLNINLSGVFDRQRGRLGVKGMPCSVRALRNIETSEAVFEINATQDQLALLKSVSEMQVVGVRFHHVLEERAVLPAGAIESFASTCEPSPLAKKFTELVKGSGYWSEVNAEYKPYDSFDIEMNVPLGLAGNPHVVLPKANPVWFVTSEVMLGTYKTPYPGINPKRFQAFVVTPKENLVPHYPITSAGDLELRRSDDERYFTSISDTINCYHESEKRGLPVHEIAAEFGGRTAQEMIDYFKPFDEEPRDTFPIFPSDSQ